MAPIARVQYDIKCVNRALNRNRQRMNQCKGAQGRLSRRLKKLRKNEEQLMQRKIVCTRYQIVK